MQLHIGALLLAIFAQLCLHSSANYTKEWNFEGKSKFFFDREIAKADYSFLYALCDDSQLPTDVDCEVTIETPFAPGNTTRMLTCPLRLRPEHGGEVLTGPNNQPFLQLTQLGEKRAIVSWREGRKSDKGLLKQRLRISVVDVSSCTNSHIKIPIVAEEPFLGNVVVYGDRYFEVIATNPELCRDSEKCRLRYDVSGAQVGDPIPFMSNLRGVVDIKPVAADNTSKGFLVSGKRSDQQIVAQLVSADGTVVKPLLTFDPTDGILYRTTSTAHELPTIGWYSTKDEKITAAHYNAEGKHLLNVTVYALPDKLAVHGVKENDVALLIAYPETRNETFKSIYFVNGQRQLLNGKSFNLPGLDAKCNNEDGSQLSVGVRDINDEFCLYYVCARQQFEKELQIGVRAVLIVSCMPMEIKF